MTSDIKIHTFTPVGLLLPLHWLLQLLSWFRGSSTAIELADGRIFYISGNYLMLVPKESFLLKNKIVHTQKILLHDAAYRWLMLQMQSDAGKKSKCFFAVYLSVFIGKLLGTTFFLDSVVARWGETGPRYAMKRVGFAMTMSNYAFNWIQPHQIVNCTAKDVYNFFKEFEVKNETLATA